jgi:signal transduction histidine kinase/ActR/RegA family two-component response regulator
MERSALNRFMWAAAICSAAIAGQWLLFPLVGQRVPFLLLLPAIMLATVIAGRSSGFLVLLAGLANAALLMRADAIAGPSLSADGIAAATYIVTGAVMIVVGHVIRTGGRRELLDLRELHELSTTLATIPDLPSQLQLILDTLTRMHRARHGLLSLHEPPSGTLRVAASVNFAPKSLDQLRLGGDAAARIACLERRRVIVEDAAGDPRLSEWRDVARAEGFHSVHSTPLFSRGGDVLGAISVQLAERRRPSDREIRIADICARKASVFIERARAEELARARDQRFKVVLEAAAVPFAILAPVRDGSGVIVDFQWTFLNVAAARVLRKSPDELCGRRAGDVMPGAWDYPGLFDLLVAAVERNETGEHELRATDAGSEGWFYIVASPLEDAVAVWFADITDRKAREHELQQADRRKDEFIATLAHELRNPLAPIRQAALIASDEKATEAQKRWSYSVIERQVQHLSLLLEDLLDVSRITRGTLQLRKEPTDLQSIVSGAIETARPLIDSRGHRFVLDLPAEKIELDADRLRLAQVFSNLLNNAAKYTNPGGSIRLSAERVGRELVVKVEDDGIGIAPEELPHIFEMFSQVRSVKERSEGGLGIGLALTKGFVELHGGSIEVSSAGPNRGATFTVRLPIASAPAPAAAAVALPPAAQHATPKRRILVADDNRDAAESLALLLRMDGHDVIVAHDGETALELFAKHSPEVCLLDIGMPGLSGYDVARRLRSEPRNSGVLLVATTGWGQDGDRLRSVAAGFDYHLTKPVALARLRDILRPPDTSATGRTAADGPAAAV